MESERSETVVERFPPTSGRFSGILGLLTAVVVLVAAVWAGLEGTALGVAIVAVLGAVLVWIALLRPQVSVTESDLVLRGMLHTDRIPLAAIEKVVITQVLAVAAGGRRFVSPAIGHSVRESAKRRRLGGLEQQGFDDLARAATPRSGGRGAVQEYVESRIVHLAEEERARHGVPRGSAEQRALAAGIRRTWAWPEIGGIAVLALAFLVWLAL